MQDSYDLGKHILENKAHFLQILSLPKSHDLLFMYKLSLLGPSNFTLYSYLLSLCYWL